jgi:hypothetical protein
MDVFGKKRRLFFALRKSGRRGLRNALRSCLPYARQHVSFVAKLICTQIIWPSQGVVKAKLPTAAIELVGANWRRESVHENQAA